MKPSQTMTPAEIFLETLRPDGRPPRMLQQYEALGFVFGNPVDQYMRAGRVRGAMYKDRWGVTIVWPEDAPGAMPHITPETKVCPDVTHWRDYVHVPDLIANTTGDWEPLRRQADEVRAQGKLATVLMGCGIFEQTHNLMGFEDTLTGLYEHPAEMHKLIEAITEYRLTYLRLIIDNMHPDAILSHDDWGAKDALFMQADMWREFFLEPYRRFYGEMRKAGVIAIHHADSYLAPIVEDMADIGIQCWQGVLPENDIPALQRRLKGRMVLMGGVGAAIDRADSTREEIYDYTRTVCETCCPGGHFIPCITYGLPGTVFKHADPVVNEAIADYNRGVHFPRPLLTDLPRRTAPVTAAAAVATDRADDGDLLSRLAQALFRGQRKKTMELTRQAIEAGLPAADILQQGLVAGMNDLGSAFSAGKAFVPEMLMTARCMTGAMELLKPLLVAGASATAGRVCIGTVKGDMHDIGKNLVKIMMEGAGLDVIDLGTDVPA